MNTTNPRTFRKKPVTVQAMQWTGDNEAALTAWGVDFYPVEPVDRTDDPDHTGCLYVAANGAWIGVPTGEWVLRDSAGFYPCRADIFAETYEPADTEPTTSAPDAADPEVRIP